jgi:uncharacterized protein YjbI with pentapeptide repeats
MTKHRTVLVTASLATLLVLFAPAPVARADIFQWQYINPADPTQGKQQSTTLCPDGAGANAVSGAYLSTLNLTKAYLIGADLTGALAQGANFTNADLSHANLTYASFDSYFDYPTNLTGANLSQANLTNASFYQATLTAADLTGAQVRGAFLNRVTGFTSAQLYSTASYQNHDLTGIQLGGDNLNLSGWNFAGQNLTSAGFEYATLTGAKLTGANLTATYFNHSILSDADLTGATFTSSSFDEATLSNTNLSNTNLTGVSFYLAKLTGANLTGANIRGAWLTDTTGLTPAQIYSTASYQNHDLTEIRLDGNNLAGGYFAGQNLTNATFIQAALNNGNFSGANLTGAIFSGATLTGANLAGSEVRGATFANTASSGFTSAQLYSTASYAAHDLTGIDLSYNNLAGWNFAGQNLTGASFSHATLQNTNLRQTDLTNSNFGYGTLTGANLTGADVRGADFRTDINGSNVVTAAQLYSTLSYQNHDLAGIGLGYHNLTGWNFAGQNLTNASFWSGILGNADFHGANLSGANFTAPPDNPSVRAANLTGANFTGADVRGASFSNTTGFTVAQLYSTASYQAHDLTAIRFDADFAVNGIDFSGANFAGQNLTNAGFVNCTLTGTNLSGAQVRGANFGATVELGFTAAQLYSTASYQAHDLTGIHLSNNTLAAWNFAGQNLTNANLSSANLSNADFSQANLTNTYFQPYSGTVAGANLSGADARGSDLSDPFLDSAATNNLIHSDGHIAGLDLAPGASLVVRYYAGDPNRGLGPISVTVQNHVTLGNGSALTVNGGTLRFTLASGSPTIGTGVSAVVSSGATLELAGSVSALANGADRVNITNNSTAPGILVSGTNQQVGKIDGSGSTQVNAGSDLTANHIIQSALIIGGTAGNPALVTIDASDVNGNPLCAASDGPLDQPNESALAGSLTPSGPFGAPDMSFASSITTTAGSADLAVPAAGNSVGISNGSQVPEPPTLLLALLAVLAVFSTKSV